MFGVDSLIFTNLRYYRIKAGFHLNECADSAEEVRIKYDWSGDYRSMEKCEPLELIN